jgi:hypothetical protein
LLTLMVLLLAIGMQYHLTHGAFVNLMLRWA